MKFMSLVSMAGLSLGLLACPVGPSGPSDAGSTDSGGTHDGAGADTGGRDATTRDSAGHDGGIGFDATGFDLQGFDISEYDVGLVEYDGGEEPGVMCAGAACAVGTACCAGIGTACDPGTGCGMLTISVPCDGPEDCLSTQDCCVTGTSATDFNVACVDQGTCPGTLVCTTSAACGVGMVCCSAQLLSNLGADLGWCEMDHCGN